MSALAGPPPPPTVLGKKVVISRVLPIIPDHKEDARRIVRTGLKKRLPWLKIHAGPEPGEQTHAVYSSVSSTIYVSPEVYHRLRKMASEARASESFDTEVLMLVRDAIAKGLGYGISDPALTGAALGRFADSLSPEGVEKDSHTCTRSLSCKVEGHIVTTTTETGIRMESRCPPWVYRPSTASFPSTTTVSPWR